jgi:hypothetical protein
MLGDLEGAARRAFQHKYMSGKHEIRTWTMAQAKSKIASLVPDHRPSFTKQAIAMSFNCNVKTLVNDIQQLGSYLTHGEMEVNDKRLAFEMLQDKMQEACPDVFTVAQTAFSLQFELKPQFRDLIQDAVKIMDTLTIHNRLPSVQDLKAERAGPSAPDFKGYQASR